VCVFCVCV